MLNIDINRSKSAKKSKVRQKKKKKNNNLCQNNNRIRYINFFFNIHMNLKLKKK